MSSIPTSVTDGEDTLTRRRRAAAAAKNAAFRVLLVEDDAAIVRLVSRLLASAGMEVLAHTTGASALAALDREEWEICLLDRWLPDLDGMEICRRIKAESRFDARQVVMLSGFADVTSKVEAFSHGADDYIAKPFQPMELLARINAARRVVEMQKQLLAMTRQLEELSIRDELTGVFNRRHFAATLERAFDQSLRYRRPLSVAIVDVDRFKSINDTLGHQAGDVVLAEVARRLASSIRSSDYVARYGGEEFVVVLPETPLTDAVSFGEKLRRTVASRPVRIEGRDVPVTISVGTASRPHSAFETSSQMIAAADRALYRAKHNGRNRVESERRRARRETCGAAMSASM
jgi:two-component system, cell cycle response regulator